MSFSFAVDLTFPGEIRQPEGDLIAGQMVLIRYERKGGPGLGLVPSALNGHHLQNGLGRRTVGKDEKVSER